jgi:1,6-anhydro-N-acetylmuramate kinase
VYKVTTEDGDTSYTDIQFQRGELVLMYNTKVARALSTGTVVSISGAFHQDKMQDYSVRGVNSDNRVVRATITSLPDKWKVGEMLTLPADSKQAVE